MTTMASQLKAEETAIVEDVGGRRTPGWPFPPSSKGASQSGYLQPPPPTPTRRARADTAESLSIGMIPIALSSSLSESSASSLFSAVSSGKEEEEDQAPLLLPKTTYSPSKLDPRERKGKDRKAGRGVVQGMASLGAGSSDSVMHESLLPQPLAVGQSGKKKKEEKAESGWWGPLAGVIGRPKGEFDPGNVV
ncbi:hypothetical protein QBC40DRAFT_280498 [Triangularia verruculosa]|uniref:Uncharacterized protein n=1 Tax=Triangularia verruculosa TaxID=2587418 RepID=A0AAN6XGD6_9PEZI|nr:hypothetical protein QBC40DRAFT_280498 [Triangularia verruculosa]